MAKKQNAKAGFAGAHGSANITRSQLDILDHTEHRAAGGNYCGGAADMDALVDAGLMVYAGRKSFVPDPYYRITEKGRAVLRSPNVPDQRPRATDIRLGTETQSRGSLHPACSASRV